MFEDLDSIDWKSLHHSHGTAEEVPSQLRALASGSEHDAEDPLNYFWEFMLHQGSHYEVSPYVVRFLFEVLDSDTCCIRRELMDLLLGLAVGFGESFLPRGYHLETEERRFKDESWDGLFSYGAARDSYYEVRKRADLFSEFIAPRFDDETRLSASFALAHFAEDLSDLHHEVGNQIIASSDDELLHGLMLCFGMLCRFASSPDVDLLLPFVEDSSSKTLQVSSSIALVTSLGTDAPESSIETLYVALAEAWEVSAPRENHLWWNEGDLIGYAALALPLLGPERKNEIASVLCSALSRLNACTYSIPQTLLDVLFPEPMPAGGWREFEFNGVQRAAL